MSDTTTTERAQTREQLDALDAITAGAGDLAAAAHWLGERLELLAGIYPPYLTVTPEHRPCISIMCQNADEMARATRVLMAGAPVSAITKKSNDHYVKVTRQFGNAFVEAWTERSAVCELVVTGTELVEVFDPDAPKVTIERDVTEWRCAPILGGAS